MTTTTTTISVPTHICTVKRLNRVTKETSVTAISRDASKKGLDDPCEDEKSLNEKSNRPLLSSSRRRNNGGVDTQCFPFAMVNPLLLVHRLMRSLKMRRVVVRRSVPLCKFTKLQEEEVEVEINDRVHQLIQARSVSMRRSEDNGSIGDVQSQCSQDCSVSIKDTDGSCSSADDHSDNHSDNSMNYIQGVYSDTGLSTLYEVDEEDLTEASSLVSQKSKRAKKKKREEELKKTQKLAQYLKFELQAEYDYSDISPASSFATSVDEEEYIWDSLWEMYPSMPNDPCDPIIKIPGRNHPVSPLSSQGEVSFSKNLSSSTSVTDSDNSLSGGELSPVASNDYDKCLTIPNTTTMLTTAAPYIEARQ